MYYYSITINPAPLKKWDKPLISRLVGTPIKSCNYDKLSQHVQKIVLDEIVKFFKDTLRGFEWSESRYELTDRGNLHLHTMMCSEVNADVNKYTPVEYINDIFSSGLKYKAIYVEKTVLDRSYWINYMNKDVLMMCDLPDTESDDDFHSVDPSE